jgi:hypothetical protein
MVRSGASGGAAALALVLSLSAGCGGSGDGAPAAGGVTFATVYSTIVSKRCVPCHGNGPDSMPEPGLFFGHLDMSTEASAYAGLVNTKSTGTTCGPTGMTRVVPGNSQASLMYLKVSAPVLNTMVCGDGMPDDGTVLTLDQVNLIQMWIDDGAKP